MEPLSTLSLIAGGLGSLITIITFITLIFKPLRQRFIKWVSTTAQTESTNRKIDDLDTKIDQITGLVEKSIEQNNKLQKDMDMQNSALQSSLRNQILILYYDCRNKEYITAYESECLDKLYTSYTQLGGNHFIETCYEYLTHNLKVKND